MKACYVHIPFCASICAYCAFFRTVAKPETVDAWLTRILEESRTELRKQKEKDPSFSLSTLYFGGGTPNVLSSRQLEQLARVFQEHLDPEYEWSLECNPELVTSHQAREFRRLGINRISLGVQSMQDHLLQKTGRHHRKQDVVQAVRRLKQAGFSNISADLIYALPAETMEDLEADLDAFLELDLPHLSIYSLQIEENSAFGRAGLQPADEDLEADMYERICTRLKQAGYLHYEISSFCRPGYESRHNLVYWQDQEYIGIGPGACGYENGDHYENRVSLSIYIEKGDQRVWMEDSAPERAFEAVMMSLRCAAGLDIDAWNRKYRRDFQKEFEEPLGRWCPDYLILNNGWLYPQEKGMEILNTILLDFMDF